MGNVIIIDSYSEYWLSVGEYLVILYIMLKSIYMWDEWSIWLFKFCNFVRGLRLSCLSGLYVCCESLELGLDCWGFGIGWFIYQVYDIFKC